jgi:hypothetical protein
MKEADASPPAFSIIKFGSEYLESSHALRFQSYSRITDQKLKFYGGDLWAVVVVV